MEHSGGKKTRYQIYNEMEHFNNTINLTHTYRTLNPTAEYIFSNAHEHSPI